MKLRSIHIIREVAAEFENPVKCFTQLVKTGRDASSCIEGILSCKTPFPLLHVDTGWKFKDMIAFRDNMAKNTWF
ncbi:phosphoadenosine phosphosulfate reductase family protein [Acinetobacter baumannii]